MYSMYGEVISPYTSNCGRSCLFSTSKTYGSSCAPSFCEVLTGLAKQVRDWSPSVIRKRFVVNLARGGLDNKVTFAKTALGTYALGFREPSSQTSPCCPNRHGPGWRRKVSGLRPDSSRGLALRGLSTHHETKEHKMNRTFSRLRKDTIDHN